VQITTRTTTFYTMYGGSVIVGTPLTGGKSYLITAMVNVSAEANSTLQCGISASGQPSSNSIVNWTAITSSSTFVGPITLTGSWAGGSNATAYLYCKIASMTEATTLLAGTKIIALEVGSVTNMTSS
jgi:hypothetical protein